MALSACPECKPCGRCDIRSISVSWCSGCEEILCESCDKARLGHRTCSRKSNSSLQQNEYVIPIILSVSTIDLSRYGKCSVSHIDITDDNKVLLCHYHGKKILLYTDGGTFVDELDLHSSPYGIAILPYKNEAVVTFLKDCFLKFINTKFYHLCHN